MIRRRKFFAAAAAFVATMKGQELTCQVNPEACGIGITVLKYPDNTFSTVHRDPVCTDGEITEGHDWRRSAWIKWDDSLHVPGDYSPQKVIRVEVCANCGFLRVPPESLKDVVENGR